MNEDRLTVTGGLMPAMDVETYVRRWNTMTELVRSVMKEGQHYGTIPGTNKPTLLKPGAEMLTTFFGLRTIFASKRMVEDWSGEDHGGEPFFYYLETCQLWRGDTLMAEADGSANSHESRYRWRWVLREEIPVGLDATRLKTREGTLVEYQYAVRNAETTGRYAKPVEYWQQFKDAIAADQAVEGTRKARSGKEYKTWEIGGTTYRVPNEDIASVVNTVKKIAQKRAFVAATLIAVNASEFFTQDLEDVDVANGAGVENGQTTDGTVRKSTEQKRGNQQESSDDGQPETANGAFVKGKHWIKYDNARAAFWAWTGELGLTHDEVHEALGVEHVEDYEFSMQAAKERILAWIDLQMTEPTSEQEAALEQAELLAAEAASQESIPS